MGRPFLNQMPRAQAQAIARHLVDVLMEDPGEDEFLGLELRPMADGSTNWAVFTAVVDADNDQHDIRTVISAAGEILSTEEMN